MRFIIKLILIFSMSCVSVMAGKKEIKEWAKTRLQGYSLEKYFAVPICTTPAISAVSNSGKIYVTGFSKISSITAFQIGDQVTKRNGVTFNQATPPLVLEDPPQIVSYEIIRDGKPITILEYCHYAPNVRNLWKSLFKSALRGDAEESLNFTSQLIQLVGVRSELLEIQNLIFANSRRPDFTSYDYKQLVYNMAYYLIQEHSQYQTGLMEQRGKIMGLIEWLSQNNAQFQATDLLKIYNEAIAAPSNQTETINIPDDSEEIKTLTSGTCFSISPDGYIVTNNHVIDGKSNIKVTLSNNLTIPVSIFVNDKTNDIAILKADVSGLDFIKLAKSRTSSLGETVFTIGYPASSIMGDNAKYTEGVISAFSGLRDAPSYMQISVPIQPGNSGGPLVNAKGEAIGIVSARAADLYFLENTGSLPQNVNWAVKAEYVQLLVDAQYQQVQTSSKAEAIERTQNAVCRVIAQ